jgi:predicted DNA-binding transcriptional regulator AlpA
MVTAHKRKLMASAVPKRHHLDRRAAEIIGVNVGAEDELLTTEALARWLNVSTQWLEIGRHRGYGPKYQKLSTRCVRYMRGDVLAWLRTRTHSRTSEYANQTAA